ncbi:MAG: choice-of-anchor J domain-containing protein, partial [Bacteroidales bacterium]|nr:choice-of-anchor J domain-containing protein [Bacteroidales bacterium]
MKKKVFSLMMMLLLGFFGFAQAQQSLPYTEGFENGIGGWTMSNCHSSTGVTTTTSYVHQGSAAFAFHWYTQPPQYLISPELAGAEAGLDVEFYYKAGSSYYDETFQVGYSTTTNDVNSFTFGEEITAPNDWATYTNSFPAGTKYVAVKCTSDDAWYLCVDDFSFTAGEGGDEPVNPDEPGYTDGLHVLSADGTIDTVNVGSRPLNAWMAPYVFKMYNESNEDYTVTVLDFTPNDGVFENLTEVPYELAAGDTTDITIDVHPTEAGVINRQFVAIYEGTRLAHIWPITAEAYTPICPDVVEVAYELNDGEPIEPGFTWKEFMSTIWAGEDTMDLHNDYTLPYPEVPEGKDAVMKFTLDKAMMLSAKVSTGENGKVALYTADFNGEEGPMADNNYTERPMSAGGSANTTIDFETGDFSQFNNFTNDSNYPWVVTADAAYTGSFGMKSGNAGVASSTSAFTATVNYTRDGSISFDYAAWGEGSSTYWDHCDFYIDGTRVIYAGASQAWNQFSQEVAAGEHTFKWSYTKDSSVNPTGDCFRVDNIVFEGGRMRTDASELAINEGFESASNQGLPTGWTMIDADGDGYNWYTLNWIEAGWEETGAHTGDQWATSASYFGEALNPDNYLVSPQVTLGGTLTFWACAQDASWAAEKFGVAVSTTGNTSASDFTTLQSWTMTAKGLGARTPDTRDGNRQGSWYQYTVDLSNYAGQTGYVAIRHYGCTDMFRLNVDDIQLTAVGGNEPEEPVVAGVGPEIDSLNVVAGTYYLVASSTDDDFEVEINIDELPCPFEGVTQIYPEDNAEGIEPNSVTLRWKLNPYCTEYRLVFSSTYWPDDEPNNPFTIITDWSSDLAESYTVTNLFNNTNYFWRIDQRSNGGEEEGGCTVTGEVFGFTTHFNKPQNLVATPDEIFEGQTVTLTWNAVVDRTYRYYYIYKDGVKIGETTVNQIGQTSFVVPASELTYNMNGYIFNVTAVYDEGESDFSNDAEVKVSGYSNATGINGYAYEQDGETPIEGVTVTITGTDEFDNEHVYTATTDENGYYHVQVYVGNYTNAVANKEGYQTTVTNHELPFDVALNGQVDNVNFIMDENFVAPAHVCAELVEVDGEELVKVWWDFDFYNALIEDFETGDLSKFDWVNSASYPWTVTTTSPYEGTYCLKSGGAGVASVVSDLSVTVDVPNDGKISFFVKPSCEQNWDYGYFYIDGTQKGSFTGAGSWAEKKYDITAGEHTFKWSYQKDGSVNANDDCIYVDYITFNVLPDPPVVGNDYNFDNGLQGWTNIDADGDGYIWVSSADPGAYHNAGVDLTGLGHNDSEAFVLSGSYTNAQGMALHPDNYLVSPQVQLGGMVKFYAQAQDVNYAAEHFGLAVSTTSNTDASAFTTIQEWTMTAKNAGPKSGVRGVRAGNWYEYTVDLSAYSGMGYVAIRHFNCSDEFILNVDDITIGDPAKGGDRALNHYNIYRTDCYNDGPYNDTTTLFLATVWRPDTAYFDVSWPDAAPGVYKWGVSSVYAGNRVVDYPAEPRESDIVWSNMCSPCIDKDMTIDSLVSVNVLLNSADSPEGTVVTFTNLNEGEQAAHPMDPITLDATGFYRFPSFRKGDYTVTVEHDGYETITDTPVSIWEPVDLRYVMIEILYGIDNLYVSRTGWAMWDAQGDAPTPEPTPEPGETFEDDFEAGNLSNWTTLDADNDGDTWQIATPAAYGIGDAHSGTYCASSWSWNNYSMDPDNWMISPEVAGATSISYFVATNTAYPDHYAIMASSTGTNASDFTMVFEEDAPASKGVAANGVKSSTTHAGDRAMSSWNARTVDLPAGTKYV